MSSDGNYIGEVSYTHELGPRQVGSLGLRASLPVLAFLMLGPLAATSGSGAPLALILGSLLWLPTVLSYLELAGSSSDNGIYGIIAQYRSGLVPFLATWSLLFSNLVAVALLAYQAAWLVQPWLELWVPLRAVQDWPGLSAPIALPAVPVLVLILTLVAALLRRRPWRRSDDLLLVGGLAAVVTTAVAAILQPGDPATASLEGISFRGIASGALLPILMLLAVEAMGEWKSDLRQAERRLPRVTLTALAILVSGSLVLLVSGLRLGQSQLADQGLAAVLGNLSLPYLPQLLSVLFLLTILAAASTMLLQANRLIRRLAREGYLPRLGHPMHLASTIGGLLGLVLLSATVLILLSPEAAIAALTGLLAVTAGIVNLTAILWHPEPDDERPPGSLVLPFPPLIPALGLSITLFLVLTLSQQGLPVVGVILVTALLMYLAYGRSTHRATQEARTVFRKRAKDAESEPSAFRILVPLLDNATEQRALIGVAVALAKAQGGEVLALQVITVPPQQSRAEGERLARERNQLLQWSLGKFDESVPVLPLTRIGRDPVGAIIDTAREQNCNLVLLTWRPVEVETGPSSNLSSIAQRTRLVSGLVRGAPCMVAAVDGQLPQEVKRILVPTAGGPHAPLAAKFALELARLWGAQVVGLNIVRDDEEEARALARERVLNTFQGLDGADQIEVRLVVSDRPIAATLVGEANSGYDLVMLGASNEGLLDRVLFGDIPQQVAEQTDVPAIMVRSERPAQEAWARLLWDRIQGTLPTLDGEEQIELYRSLRRGARPTVNYFVLIVLSALIATLGLWQNSAAVIIGAMLVAPLMTPILATSLGVVLGDARTIRIAIEATAKGVTAGIAIALFFTLILPQQLVGSEILARTRPTVLDLIVALASGAAGAYAIARKEVSAALPGVAIAAALMPPLCTVGIGLASFSASITGGALLLFTTNLIAINVAGGLIFLLMGMRPRKEQAREAQFRRGLRIIFALLLIISVPLTWLGIRNAEQIRNETVVGRWLPPAVSSAGDVELLNWRVEREGKHLEVYARVQSHEDIVEDSTVAAWSQFLAEKTGRQVHLQVDIQPVRQLQATSQ